MSNNEEVVSGAKEIARVLGRSERWLRDVLGKWPLDRRPPVKRDPSGRLFAVRSDLVQYVRHMGAA